MVVKCIKIFDSKRNIIEYSNWIKLGGVYTVLEIYYEQNKNIMYRIITEDNGVPALFEHDMFEVLNGIIPDNWVVYSKMSHCITIGPEAWSNDDFWESYFNVEKSAIECYNQEVKKILDF